MASASKRALVLAYFFPPNSDGGVPRTVKFVKYLREFGWRCTLIAPNWEVPQSEDVGFGKELPADTEVVRAGIGGADGRLWKVLRKVPKFWEIEPAVRATFQYPDPCRCWSSAVIPVARQILAQGKHHVLYSTSPPVTSHYIAMQLKAEFQIPWVADFRDPWTDSAMGYFNPFKWRRRLDVRLERRIYQIADLTIANTISNRQTILTKHQVPVEKVLTITNGYDEEDFADIPPAPPCVNRFRIMYAGSFYGSYNPTVFLQAFREFLRTEPDANVVLTLAGSCCSWAKGFIKDPMVLRHLEPLGYLPHRHVCKLLAGSDLLLHVYPKGIPYSVPGKLYEYLRTGRPIVAVCDRPSELASLLEQTGCGRAFRHCDLRDLTQFLRECYARWRAGDAPPTRTPAMCVRAYDRRTLTRQLACIFDALAGHNTMDMVLSR